VKRFLSFGIASSVLCLSFAAQAAPAFTANSAQIGVGIGYGIFLGDEGPGGDFNPYGVGVWVRGGYTLNSNIYLGGNFDYYFGESEGDVSMNIYQFMFEPGYDIALAPTAVLRPVLGVGYSTYHVDLGPFGDASQSEFGIAPGAVFLVDFGKLYGTASARYNHIFVEDGNADGLLLGAGVGFRF
jgi:hypothetical protein